MLLRAQQSLSVIVIIFDYVRATTLIGVEIKLFVNEFKQGIHQSGSLLLVLGDSLVLHALLDEHRKEGLLLNGQVLTVADEGQNMLGVKEQVIVPGILLNLHQLFTSMLHICFVHIPTQSLEL